MKETKSQRDKESKSQRDKETKRQRDKESKSQRDKETKRLRVKESKRRGLPQPLPKGKGFVAALMHRTWGAFWESKRQRDKESKSQRDKESKSQKVKKSKRQRDKESKRQRVKESKRLRVKKTKSQRDKGSLREGSTPLELCQSKVKTYVNLLHNDLLVADDIEAGGQSAEVRVSGGQDADGASEGVHHANCSFLLVSDGGANGRG